MDPHWASVYGSKRYFYCGISVCPEAVGSRAEGLKSVLTYDREKCRRVCGVDDGADNGLAVEANWGSASHAYFFASFLNLDSERTRCVLWYRLRGAMLFPRPTRE